MIKNFDGIIGYSLDFIKDDFTELWIIVNKIQEENPSFTLLELIDSTKAIISELMENYSVCLLDEETRTMSALTKGEIIQRVEDLMTRLGRAPNIGDGIWFTVCE